jgi:hypothetical protein
MNSTLNHNQTSENPLSWMSTNKDYIQLSQKDSEQDDNQPTSQGSFLVCCIVFSLTSVVVIFVQILILIWLTNQKCDSPN